MILFQNILRIRLVSMGYFVLVLFRMASIVSHETRTMIRMGTKHERRFVWER